MVAIAVGISMVIVSLNPENYFYYVREDARDWQWPWQSVLLFLGFVTIETLVFYKAVFSAVSGKLLVSLFCSVLLFAWAIPNVMFVMHQPFYYFYHLLWLLALNTIALSAFLFGVGRKIRVLLAG